MPKHGGGQKGGRKGQKGGRKGRRVTPYTKKTLSLPLTLTAPGLNIFAKPPTNNSIFGIEPRKVYPINDALNPIEFHIDNREKWIDIQRSYLHFNVGLQNKVVPGETMRWE